MAEWRVTDEPGRAVSRRRFVVASVGLVGAGVLGVEGVLLQPGRLQVTEHVLGDPSPGRDPIRLAVLTDLHLAELTPFHRQLATGVDQARPDVILVVGDSIDDRAGLPALRAFLRLLPPGPLRLATLGNWEYWSGVEVAALRRAYAAGGTRLLVNEAFQVGDGAAVFGLDDSLAGTPRLQRLPGDAGTELLLLSHCPDLRDRLRPDPSRPVRAMISGHTHGGQVALGRWSPFCPPGSGDYVSGWYRDPDRIDLFVSRGLGTSVVPVRLGSPPELALVTWHPGPGQAPVPTAGGGRGPG